MLHAGQVADKTPASGCVGPCTELQCIFPAGATAVNRPGLEADHVKQVMRKLVHFVAEHAENCLSSSSHLDVLSTEA